MKLTKNMKDWLVAAYNADGRGAQGPVRAALMRRGLVYNMTAAPSKRGYLTLEGIQAAKEIIQERKEVNK